MKKATNAVFRSNLLVGQPCVWVLIISNIRTPRVPYLTIIKKITRHVFSQLWFMFLIKILHLINQLYWQEIDNKLTISIAIFIHNLLDLLIFRSFFPWSRIVLFILVVNHKFSDYNFAEEFCTRLSNINNLWRLEVFFHSSNLK